MKVTIEKQPNCKATVRVETPREMGDTVRLKVVNEYSRYAKLPGFRPGKIPVSVVEKRFADEIKSAVRKELVDEGFRSAVKQEGLQILSVQNVADAISEEGGTAFQYEVTLAPEFELPEYKGLKIQLPKFEVTEDFIDEMIERQREQYATLKDVPDRPSQMGDFVVVDYKGKINGQDMKELVPESEAFMAENSGFLLKLESANFLPGFCDQVAGAKVGETKIVVAKIPDEVNSAVAGADAVYEVTVKAVKEQELPEVNDAFAERVLPGHNLEQLRAEARKRMEDNAKQAEREQKRTQVVAALRNSIQFDLPESAVNNAAQRRVNELVNMNLKRGVDQATLVENEEAILQEATKQAAMDVKDEFLLGEIAQKEEIKVTESEMTLRISNMAATAQTSPKNVLKILKKDEGFNNLRYRIMLDKTIDLLVENADVTYVDVPADPAR